MQRYQHLKKKSKPILTMVVLENLKIVDYPLSIFTNWALLYIFRLKNKNIKY
jgi:hypothetical protein